MVQVSLKKKILEVFIYFKHFVSMVENVVACKIGTLCVEQGGENTSKEFHAYMDERGIKHQCTLSHTHQ